MEHNVTAPTAKQVAKGPVVILHRDGWNVHAWTPHGFSYPIRFMGGKATVLTDHFDEWIGGDLAESMGIEVERPAAPKPVPKKAAVKKAPAPKKIAAKRSTA